MNRKIIVLILSVFMMVPGFTSFVMAEENGSGETFIQETPEETPAAEEENPSDHEGGSEEADEETEIPGEETAPPEEPAEDQTEQPGAEETAPPEETAAPEESKAPDFVMPEPTPSAEPEEETPAEEPEAVIEEASSWQEVWMPPGHIISSYEDTAGSDWTSRPALAEKLDSVFRGNIGLTDWEHNEVIAPLGSHAVEPGLDLWACGRIHTGQSCFIYALGIYYTLFGEDPYLYRDHSVIVEGLSGKTELSKEILENAGLRNEPGAYLRTIGHSLIILSYDEEGIDVVQGNVGGDGFICISQYTWEEFNAAIMLGGGTSIEVVFQPTDTYFNRFYPLTAEYVKGETDSFETEFIEADNSFFFDADWLLKDETKLNPEIAKLTLGLVSADHKELPSVYEQMGFDSDKIILHTGKESEDQNSVSYSFAGKMIIDSEEHPYELIFVTVTSRDDISAYLDTFKDSENTPRDSFFEQAEQLKKELDEFTAGVSEQDAEKIYVITGNGAGGSAANILAAKLTHEIQTDETNRDAVYAYTFGALPVSPLSYEEDSEHGYDAELANIFNFVNPNDPAIRLPDSLCGYQTNGKTIVLNHGKDDPVYLNFRNRFRDENSKAYRPLSPDYESLALLSGEEKQKLLGETAGLLREERSFASMYDLLTVLYGDAFDLLNKDFLNGLLEEIQNGYEAGAIAKLDAAETALNELIEDMDSPDGDEAESEETVQAELNGLRMVLDLKDYIREKEDLTEAAVRLEKTIAAVKSLSAVRLKYFRLFVSQECRMSGLFNDTHDLSTYRLWINSMYYGDHGWQSYDGKGTLPDFAARGILTIGESCFAGTKMSGTVNLERVHAAGKEAFRGSQFESLIIGPLFKELAGGCFADMGQLKEITMPADTVFIPGSGKALMPFAGDTAVTEITYTGGREEQTEEEQAETNGSWRPEQTATATVRKVSYGEGVRAIPASDPSEKNEAETLRTEVVIPSTLERIGAHAFDHWNIRDIYIPESVTSIDATAFENNPDLTVYVHKDSYAEQFAQDHGLETVSLEKAPERITLNRRAFRMKEGEDVKPGVKADPGKISDALKYASSDESVVKADEGGTLTAVSSGFALITVSFNDRSDSCLVRVVKDVTQQEEHCPE